MRTRSGRKITAVRMRAESDASRASLTAMLPSIGATETPAPVLEVMDRLVEVLPAKVGPQGVGDPELRVRGLPEEKIRDAELPAGADQEVRVGQSVRVEAVPEELLVDLAERDSALPVRRHDPARRVHDLGPPTVREGQHEGQPGRFREEALGVAEDVAAVLRKEVDAADGPELDVVLLQLLALLEQHLLENPHEPAHLARRALPVLEREGVEREDLDLELDAPLDHLPDRAAARLMSHEAREAAPLRPSTIPIHDDRDVRGNFTPEDLLERRRLGGK